MFKRIAGAAVLLGGAVAAVAARRPDTFSVQRSAVINAPPEQIFPLISDFRNWSQWSPYEQLDPGMRRAYSGAPSGVGAVYEWDGNRKAGAGRMEITGVLAPSRVTIKLDFSRPMEGHHTAEFLLEPQGDATRVTWDISGPNPFLSKLMGLFINMDQLVGKDFETGLATLKAVAER